MSSLPSSKSITGIKSNTLNSKLRMALNPRFHGDYSFEAKLKNCDVPIKFVVIFGKWNKDDDNKYHILITNNLRASAKTVVTNYLLRWGIEHSFKEIKQAVNSILEFASTNALSKNEKLANGYFKIKSKRLKKKCAA